MNTPIMDVFGAYNDALSRGDFAAVFETLDDDITWHQPGNNPHSGVITGKQALGEHLTKLAEKSNGTLKIVTNWASDNGNFVAANVTFTAQRPDKAPLNMNGIDIFRIEKGKIKEVWLFSLEQSIEDQFWA